MNTATQNVKDEHSVTLRVMLENKQKSITDLTLWLNRHKPEEPEYAKVTNDRIAVQREVDEIEAELASRDALTGKPFVRSLNETFEL